MRLSILWRIMEIKEVRWGRRTRRITHSKISIMLHMIQKPNYNLANIQSDWLQNKGKVTLGLQNYNSKNFSRKNIYLIIFNNNYIWQYHPREELLKIFRANYVNKVFVSSELPALCGTKFVQHNNVLFKFLTLPK